MRKPESLIEHYLCEQVALEEQMYKVIEQQIGAMDEALFPEARQLLINAKEVLDRHFVPLNHLLDRIDCAARGPEETASRSAGLRLLDGGDRSKVSRILLEDYALLNLIAMGNTMLHTIALALGHDEVAGVALDHLQHLAPLVVKLGDLVPQVVTCELQTLSAKVNVAIGEMAVKNVRMVWKNAT